MRIRLVLALSALLLPSSPARALERSLYVINGLAETLSRVNLETGTVTNNIQVLGLVPNQVYIDNVDRRDGIAYVVNSSSDDLQLVQLEPVALLNTISLGADRNPYSLAFLNDSVVAVSNLLANTISEVNTVSGLVDTEYVVGLAPEGMAMHNGELFVCLTAFDFNTFVYGQGQVAVVDPELDSVVATINVGTNPQAVLVDYQNEILVLCTGDFFSSFGMIYVIDPVTHTVTDSVTTGGSPGHMALAPNGMVYVAAGGWVGNGEVYSFNSDNNSLVRGAGNPIPVGTGAVGMATDIFSNAYSCALSTDQVNRVVDSTVNLNYSLGDGPGFAAVYEPRPAGDLDGSSTVTSGDVILAVNFVFKGGASPSSLALSDVNRSCTTTAADIIMMVNYVFKAGERLNYGCY